jgi:Heterokaryon incompatibility protein (HET)
VATRKSNAELKRVVVAENKRKREEKASEKRAATQASHCWGSHPIEVLTLERLEQFSRDIPTTDMAKTFVDAVEVVRALSLQYIGIDSLYILQDSQDDWLREAAVMGDGYKHLWCNIAAPRFSDSLSGLFSPRDPDLVKPFAIEISWIGGVRNGTNVCQHSNLWKREVEQAPLNNRGWVCQERYLAPRVLYFSKTQLFWECGELEASEAWPHGIPPLVKTDKFKRRHISSVEQSESKRHLSELGKWGNIVSSYCFSQLTREDGKLIAIAGIAAEVQKVLNDDYLAGHWRQQLAYQLSWNVVNSWEYFKFSRPSK